LSGLVQAGFSNIVCDGLVIDIEVYFFKLCFSAGEYCMQYAVIFKSGCLIENFSILIKSSN
jgi:hypothetical protein